MVEDNTSEISQAKTKEGFNLHRLLIAVFFVILSSFVTGGAVWYLMNKNEDKNALNYENEITNIKNNISSGLLPEQITKIEDSCKSTSGANTVKFKQYEKVTNEILPNEMGGEFASCDAFPAPNSEGASVGDVVVMKKVDNKWTKITEGQAPDITAMKAAGLPWYWYTSNPSQ